MFTQGSLSNVSASLFEPTPRMKKNKKAVLFLGGPFQKTKYIQKIASLAQTIAAADSGARHALRLGVKLHAVIGDLDSISSHIRRRLTKTKFIRYPLEKDHSDGYLALQFLLSQKPSEIVIFGTIGGRPDHSMASLDLLRDVPDSIAAKMMSHDFEIYFVRKKLILKGKKGDIVSLLPLSPSGAIVKTQGLFYPLINEKLNSGSHGLSNQMTRKKASVQVMEGALWVFHQYRKDSSALRTSG